MHPMFSDDMLEIVESFVIETQEMFEELDQDLLELESHSEDKELINKIFRAVHTVKGTSGFLEFTQMSELAHVFEDVLNKMRKEELKFKPEMLDVMLDAFDMMKALLEQVIEKTIREIDLGDIIARLEAIAAQQPAASVAAKATSPQQENAPASAAGKGKGAAPEPHPMFAEDMAEIVESFIVETEELFEQLDQDLLQLEQRADDKELINTIFRAVHTVKGTSGFLGFDQMSDLSHYFEDVLNKLRKEELLFQPWMMDIMLDALDTMKVLLQQAVHKEIKPINLETLLANLMNIAEGKKVQREKMAGEGASPHKGAAKTGPTPAPAAAPPRRKMDKTVDATIRVDVRRLDDLMNLVGELVLGRNRLAQIVSTFAMKDESQELSHELVDTSAQIDFITTELQAAVMKTRMVQIGRVFNRFPRLVRDIARESGKEIELVLEGEETEMDKSIIEEISDPLIHLIRNAADHGVESPGEREKKGKPRRGVIRLSAGHEGNHIVIMIEDDGRGIDPEKIKTKAVEKELISPEEAANLSLAEIYNLIFLPGFSTAQKVTNVSGRGVGMDVVKTNITRLNGMVSVESEVGKGTRLTLKLPLTLAIIQGLLVNVGAETFAVPLSSVIEVVKTHREEVSTIQGREVIRIRERILPLVRIHKLLEVPGAQSDPDRFYTVVIGVANHQFGLIVDDLQGQKEIVIKSLGTYLKNIPGIAGSTILGDGKVIMILDIGELTHLLQQHTAVED